MCSKIAQMKLDKRRREREAERRDLTESEEDEELGSPCFTSRIRQARKPKRFKFAMETPKYDGTQEPEVWLDDYLTAVKFQKGTQTTAMQYIQLQMVGAARSWLKSRRRGIYDSWEQFSDDFIRSFRSTCRRPVTIGELRACRQRPSEKLPGYIRRWTALKQMQQTYRMKRPSTASPTGC